jgi:Holliday junction resolvase
MRNITEQKIQRQIIEYLTLKGWFVIKNNTVGIYVKSRDSYIPNPARGLADLTAIREGRVVMIECKVAKGKQSPSQAQFEANWKGKGGEYILVRSLDEVIKSLEL